LARVLRSGTNLRDWVHPFSICISVPNEGE
jgi:hypothetical protein